MEPVLSRKHRHRHLVLPFHASTSGQRNATSSQSLQITIVPAGQAPALFQLTGGPILTATYTTPPTGTPASADVNQIDPGVTPVNDAAKVICEEIVYLRQSSHWRPHPILVHLSASLHDTGCSMQRTKKNENGGARQLASAYPPSEALSPFLGVGAATPLPLVPFSPLASTLRMTMTQE